MQVFKERYFLNQPLMFNVISLFSNFPIMGWVRKYIKGRKGLHVDTTYIRVYTCLITWHVIQQCPAMKLIQLRCGIFTSVPPLIYPQMSVHVETFSPAIVVFLHACYASNNSATVQDNTQHVWIVYIRGQVTGTAKHFVELQNDFHLFGYEGKSWSLIT